MAEQIPQTSDADLCIFKTANGHLVCGLTKEQHSTVRLHAFTPGGELRVCPRCNGRMRVRDNRGKKATTHATLAREKQCPKCKGEGLVKR